MPTPTRIPAALRRALAAQDWYSVDFGVEERNSSLPAGGLLQAVADAATASSTRTTDAFDGSTVQAQWDSGRDDSVLVSLTNPSRQESVAQYWLADLLSELDALDRQLRLTLQSVPRRMAAIEDLLEGPPALTAFVFFPGFNFGQEVHAADTGFLPEVSSDLASWLRIPGADLTYVHSGHEHRTDALGLASRLVESWPAELGRTFTAELRTPRRLRQFSVHHDLVGALQVLDRTRPLTSHLEQILEALRIVGPFADYAFVRLAAAGAPDLRDIPLALSRPETPQEKAIGLGRHRDLLQSRVVDAYVAQVLTGSHLSAIADISCFEVERLGSDRYLAHAKRPADWLDESGRRQDLATARNAFARVILPPDAK